MSAVSVDGLVKSYDGKVQVVANMDLAVEEGEFFVILGESGCGKTTTLRCVAGLETPTGGSIRIGDRTVFDRAARTDVPVHARPVGVVFQSYALWPHMTVRRNIGFPLKSRARRKYLASAPTDADIDAVARMVGCEGLLERYPGQLSGGQQQRIALARALVAKPRLLLLDEPLSNLDAQLRGQIRAELQILHRSLGFTAILVTHDQAEAFSLADRVGVMRGGRLEQVGTPQEVFDHPRSEYVAQFIGMSNRLRAPGAGQPKAEILRFWPEHVRRIMPGATTDFPWRLKVTVENVSFGGHIKEISLRADDTTLLSRAAAEDHAWSNLAIGEDIEISVAPENVRTFDDEVDGDVG